MILILVVLCNGVVAESNENLNLFKYDYDYINLYDDIYEERFIATATLSSTYNEWEPSPRVKRYESALKSFGPQDIKEVKGALRELFSQRRLQNPFTPLPDVSTENIISNEIGKESYTMVYYDANKQLFHFTTLYSLLTATRTKSRNVFKELSSSNVMKLPPQEEQEGLRITDVTKKVLTYDNSYNNAEFRATQASNMKTLQTVLSGEDITDDTMIWSNTTDSTTEITTPATTTIRKTTPEPKLDINALVNLIANLTYEYEMNLTQEFNETLQKYNIPTCPSLTVTVTTTEEPTTTEYFANATIIAKCFVCGLTERGIPSNSNCGDAFATDFLPLVPIDPRARGQVTRYRKYCRYLDIPHYFYNETIPHSIFGRWSGGCAVRWTDLTNTYTQRTCRQRLKPTTGKHFGSKRMAKLELALKDVDNGCIVSPMATLLPLSRGISLYARFHACVCTGSWCNKSMYRSRCIQRYFIITFVIFGLVI